MLYLSNLAVILILVFKTLLTGQVSFAVFAALSKVAASAPGTLATTSK